jgi:hypothetical protein
MRIQSRHPDSEAKLETVSHKPLQRGTAVLAFLILRKHLGLSDKTSGTHNAVSFVV